MKISVMKWAGIAALLLASASLFGQSERGTITGTILDASGAAVPLAKVTATNTDTNVTATTLSNETGDYTLPNLSTGMYRVRIEKEGFNSSVRSSIKLDASATVRADASMEIG